MSVLLIHPPVNDPRSPRLALPSLAACLRSAGIATTLLDLDLDGLLAVLRPDNLERAGRVVRSRSGGAGAPASERLAHLAVLSESLPEFVTPALGVLRDPDRFYHSGDLSAARDVLFSAVNLVAAASERPVTYRLDMLRYEVEGVDSSRFADLARVSEDRAANVFAGYWEDEVFPTLEKEPWDFVGISIATRMQIVPGLMLARALRKRGHYVVIGGTLFTKFLDRLLHLPEFFDWFADAVVVYEGETAVVELVQQLRGNRELEKVPNLLFGADGEVRFTGLHVENIGALPAPDFAGLPLDRYLTPERVLPVRFGRGCYWNRCKFCDSSMINRDSRQPYVFRPLECLVEDVVGLAARFECRHFLFADEAIPPRLLEQFADILLARDIQGLNFATYVRLEPGFTKEVCRKAAAMGMRRFFFGLESGCQATLDHMDKGIKIENVRPVLKNCRDAGIGFDIFSMIGFPEESEESARETAAFFEANRDLFDVPGTTFDMHLPELMLRTPYFAEASRMGVQLPVERMGGEFLVGVGTHWENTRGLTRDRVEALAREFTARFRGLYTYYDVWPALLWPGLEEWSLLYSEHYASRPYPFRLALPAGEDGELCRLRWNPFAQLKQDASGLQVAVRRGSINISAGWYDVIRDSGFLPVPALARRVAGRSDDLSADEITAVRTNVASLVRANLLQLECTAIDGRQ